MLTRYYIEKAFFYMLEIVRTELISKYHDDLLAGHLEMDKIQELIVQKYY